jgi:hypothetical protein
MIRRLVNPLPSHAPSSRLHHDDDSLQQFSPYQPLSGTQDDVNARVGLDHAAQLANVDGKGSVL